MNNEVTKRGLKKNYIKKINLSPLAMLFCI